jgi:hypothetical protein
MLRTVWQVHRWCSAARAVRPSVVDNVYLQFYSVCVCVRVLAWTRVCVGMQAGGRTSGRVGGQIVCA